MCPLFSRTLRDARSGWKQRPVRADRIRKSVGAENTFPTDLFTYEAARDALREIIDNVWGYSERSGIRGRTVTLKVKFANFRQITRSRTAMIARSSSLAGAVGR
jgi:DNA polymerase IV